MLQICSHCAAILYEGLFGGKELWNLAQILLWIFYRILQTLKMEQFLYIALVIFQLINFMQTTPSEHQKYFLSIFGITCIIYPILLLWARRNLLSYGSEIFNIF